MTSMVEMVKQIKFSLVALHKDASICVGSLKDMNSYCEYDNTDEDIEDLIAEHLENLSHIQTDLSKKKEIAENLIWDMVSGREINTARQKIELAELMILIKKSLDHLKNLEDELSRVLEKKTEIFTEIKRFVQTLPRPKIRELCKCRHYTRCEMIPVKITACGICYVENTTGIQPVCCQKKQEICLECMKEYFQSEYKSGLERKKSGPVANRKIFSIHYHCPFCRTLGCFKNYKKIFSQDS